MPSFKTPLLPSVYFSFCSLVFLSSCFGQAESTKDKDTITTSSTPSTSNNYDPYFIESENTSSSYGPNSITRNILEDRNGNIWLATWEGIIRYDGKSFTNFTNKDSLQRFHVFCILEDRKGNLWFGTIGAGVYRYDGKTFTHFTTKDGLIHDRVGCFYQDKSGNIWIGTEGGLSCYNGKTFRNFTTTEGLINNDINSIIEDDEGRMWFGARGQACVYNGVTFTEVTNDNGTPFINVRSIIKDSKGNIWLGGNNGLWRYDKNSFVNFTSDFVGYIYEDKKGNIWTSSASNGNSDLWTLSRYDEKTLTSGSKVATVVNKERGMYFGISEDKDGGIWFGSVYGVNRYDGISFNDFKKQK